MVENNETTIAKNRIVKNKVIEFSFSTAVCYMNQCVISHFYILNNAPFVLILSGIVHRDIKPENIYINHRPPLLKIGDFGLARFIEAKTTINTATASGGSQSHTIGTPASSVLGGTQTQLCGSAAAAAVQISMENRDIKRVDSVVSVKGLVIGTPGYTAPEGGALCTEKADVFSAALILLELLCPRFGTAMERYKTLENFRTRQKVREERAIESITNEKGV